jgi:hypothetical protein
LKEILQQFLLICLPWLSFSKLENQERIPQPEGLHFGGAKPPDPLGMPDGRTDAAEINFCTSPQSHLGHFGSAWCAEKTISSKQWQQALHWYS